jgi:hypothetical protein
VVALQDSEKGGSAGTSQHITGEINLSEFAESNFSDFDSEMDEKS